MNRCRARPLTAADVSVLVLIRIGISQGRQDVSFEVFHLGSLFLARFMVVGLQMQRAMNDQMRVMCFQRFALLGGFAGHHWCAEDQIATEQRYRQSRKVCAR